jgi:acyl-coenzyme A thioesterase PaaI-like protein
MVPYSGTLGAEVVRFEAGRVVVRLRDRRAVRNHLRSIHAIALANLGELTTGLAMLGSIPEGVRGIVTAIEVTYRKKARGTLEAEARCEPVARLDQPMERVVTADIRDTERDVVATVSARWRLSPRAA